MLHIEQNIVQQMQPSVKDFQCIVKYLEAMRQHNPTSVIRCTRGNCYHCFDFVDLHFSGFAGMFWEVECSTKSSCPVNSLGSAEVSPSGRASFSISRLQFISDQTCLAVCHGMKTPCMLHAHCCTSKLLCSLTCTRVGSSLVLACCCQCRCC